MHAPIFIVGANRSGTTLLRLMLNAHSRIAIPEELLYFRSRMGGSFHHWRTPEWPRERYVAFVQDFLGRNEEALKPLPIDELKAQILVGKTMNMRRPYRLALEAWAQHHGKERWGEKTPGNLFYVDVLLDMFPDAQFIYMVRDPRAGVHSMNKTDFFSNDVAINALNRHKYTTEGLAFLEQVVPNEQRIVIRYEDLVREPERTTEQLCTFLRVPFESGMINFHEDAERFMKPRAVNGFNQAATQPINKKKIDAWRGRLTSEEVATIEWVCREDMDRFDYALDGQKPSVRFRMSIWIKEAYFRRQERRFQAVPQFILQDRIFERTRQRLKHALSPLC